MIEEETGICGWNLHMEERANLDSDSLVVKESSHRTLTQHGILICQEIFSFFCKISASQDVVARPAAAAKA